MERANLGNSIELMAKGLSFDLDGVCLATSDGAIKFFNERYGKFGLKYASDLKSFNEMTGWLEEIKGYNPEVPYDNPMDEAIRIWNDPATLRKARAEKGIWTVMTFLNRNSIAPYYITSRLASLFNLTVESCMETIPGFDTRRLYIQTSGETINHDFKAQKIAELGIKVHFEDAPHHAEAIVAIGSNVIVGLVDQPWNADYLPTCPRIIRSKGYAGRPELIRTFLSVADAIGG